MHLVLTYKKQIVAYCGVKVILNLSNFTGLADFYWLYLGVILFNNMKNVTHDNIYSMIDIEFPPQALLIISPLKNHHNHYGSNNRLCNKIFLLPATKPREVKIACHPAFLLVQSSL